MELMEGQSVKSWNWKDMKMLGSQLGSSQSV